MKFVGTTLRRRPFPQTPRPGHVCRHAADLISNRLLHGILAATATPEIVTHDLQLGLTFGVECTATGLRVIGSLRLCTASVGESLAIRQKDNFRETW